MADLPLDLPWPGMHARWIDRDDWQPGWEPLIDAEGERVAKAPGWNPKLVKLSGDLVAIDLCFARGGPVSSVQVVEYVDHPFLAALPVGVPRAVRSIYTKEVRMRNLRTKDGGQFHRDWFAAEYAWGKYLIGGDGMEKIEAFLERHPDAVVRQTARGVMVEARE